MCYGRYKGYLGPFDLGEERLLLWKHFGHLWGAYGSAGGDHEEQPAARWHVRWKQQDNEACAYQAIAAYTHKEEMLKRWFNVVWTIFEQYRTPVMVFWVPWRAFFGSKMGERWVWGCTWGCVWGCVLSLGKTKCVLEGLHLGLHFAAFFFVFDPTNFHYSSEKWWFSHFSRAKITCRCVFEAHYLA